MALARSTRFIWNSFGGLVLLLKKHSNNQIYYRTLAHKAQAQCNRVQTLIGRLHSASFPADP